MYVCLYVYIYVWGGFTSIGMIHDNRHTRHRSNNSHTPYTPYTVHHIPHTPYTPYTPYTTYHTPYTICPIHHTPHTPKYSGMRGVYIHSQNVEGLISDSYIRNISHFRNSKFALRLIPASKRRKLQTKQITAIRTDNMEQQFDSTASYKKRIILEGL